MTNPPDIRPEATAPEATTRERLLQAAVDVFAEKGYDQTTVREICDRAEANVAAVCYYFNTKLGLYEAVFDHLYHRLLSARRERAAAADQPPLRQLRAFIRTRIEALFDQTSGGSRFGRVLTWEMSNPSPIFGELLDRYLRPETEALKQILATMVGPPITPFALEACLFSVMAQCAFYHNANRIIRQLAPDHFTQADVVDQLVDHIATFSTAGLTAIGKQSQGEPPLCSA